MDVIALARQLGHELQNDEHYKNAVEAAAAANNDESLAQMVSEFESLRSEIETLAADTENYNAARGAELDKQMHEKFTAINTHPAMARYAQTSSELESLVNYIVRIITQSANGENPDTVEQQSACSGSCASCGGCH